MPRLDIKRIKMTTDPRVACCRRCEARAPPAARLACVPVLPKGRSATFANDLPRPDRHPRTIRFLSAAQMILDIEPPGRNRGTRLVARLSTQLRQRGKRPRRRDHVPEKHMPVLPRHEREVCCGEIMLKKGDDDSKNVITLWAALPAA